MLFDEIYYVLYQSEKLMSGRAADISTREAAGVFQGCLRYTMEHIRDMAIEIDQENGMQ